jgi:hypothetical protein
LHYYVINKVELPDVSGKDSWANITKKDVI